VTCRLRTLPTTLPLRSATTTSTQDDALTVLLMHVERAWTAVTGAAPTDDEVRALLRVLVVDVLDLGVGEPYRATALVALRATVLDSATAEATWNHLVGLGRDLSLGRSWRRRPDIATYLDSVATPVGPSARYEADVRTLRQHSDATWRLSPTTPGLA
jgi:hypothetical protein